MTDTPSMAELALEQLLLAYAKGERDSGIEWEDVDLAFEYTRGALPGRYEEIFKHLEAEEEEGPDLDGCDLCGRIAEISRRLDDGRTICDDCDYEI
jgi:hypothetical protein